MKNYKRKTDEELKKVAKDLYKGHIFTNRDILSAKFVSCVFIPLNFMKLEDIEDWRRDPPGLIYEYMSAATPAGSPNGMLTFFSAQFLSQEDTDRMFVFYEKVKEAMDSI